MNVNKRLCAMTTTLGDGRHRLTGQRMMNGPPD